MQNPRNPKNIALESFRLIETGDAELAERIIAPGYLNHEADDDLDDVERRLPGPAGFLATSQWLRDAFSDLSFELREAVAEEGAEECVVMVAATMTGQHTGIFNGIAPTDRRIQHNQVHVFRVADGRITHHRAVRDDLGLLLQLSWRPGG
ncbi:MAG: ester cyclase [Mycobacterium sp.]